MITILTIIIIFVTIYSIADYNHIHERNFKLSPHLLNTNYSVEKCNELLDIGFYAKVGNLETKEVNSMEYQIQMYDMCVEIAEYINKP